MERADKKGTNMPKMRIRAKMQIVANTCAGWENTSIDFQTWKNSGSGIPEFFHTNTKKGGCMSIEYMSIPDPCGSENYV